MPRWIPLSLWIGLVALVPATASAQAPAQSEIDRAVALGHEGRAAYEAGRFEEALERFRAADRIAHSPVLVLYVARCERNLGRLVAARDAYRRVAEEPLGEWAPAPFVTAKAEATRELEVLEARLPRVRLELAAGSSAQVTLDGVLLSAERLASSIEVDPGEHRVVANWPGRPPEERTFRAVEGGPLLTLQLGAATAPPPSPPPSRPPSEPGGGGGTILPGVIALGVGAVGLGVGTVTGLVASSKTSDIESRCEGTSCLASDAALADEARGFATVSTIGFIVGGVAVASGVVLLVALSGDEPATARGPAAPRTIRLSASPAGVRGALDF